jgi:chorismate mutase
MTEKKLICVRGAIDVVEDTPEAITAAVKQLMSELIKLNQLTPEQVIAIFFTVTPDLHSANPAWAYRRSIEGAPWQQIPLLCSQEPIVSGMMEKVIRVLIQWYPEQEGFKCQPAYLGKTVTLRPDLAL